MRINDVLRRKGNTVITIGPSQTVRELLEQLAENGIGALVVSSDGVRVDGIVSERDIVRRLNSEGDRILDSRVATIMTDVVLTCTPHDTTDDLMVTMTQNRIRHVPVLIDSRLSGIVSIGDVVKYRLEELESERDQLAAYITR